MDVTMSHCDIAVVNFSLPIVCVLDKHCEQASDNWMIKFQFDTQACVCVTDDTNTW